MIKSLGVLALLLWTSGLVAAQDFTPDDLLADGEVVLGEKADSDFDNSITPKDDQPREQPNEDEVKRLYTQQYEKGTIDTVADPVSGCPASDDGTVGDLTLPADESVYWQFLQYTEWYKDYKFCCPATQKYQCQNGVLTYMPCFSTYYKKSKVWCCPIGKIPIANCNCSKCSVLKEDCVYTGTCRRVYRLQTFTAVCYDTWWGYILKFKKYLPSRCYCDLGCLEK
ncbi:uncharacterized protein LOC131952555 [Physella acuta]|uniref:uncharacterized protein LOC131952555 n=1 Tax=Physella acuta TaxID=109671 RepID=UPI0027DD593C|nr:uncharacterized protein LOC131952555 [Physella acuta]